MRCLIAVFALVGLWTGLPSVTQACPPPPTCSPNGAVCVDWAYRDNAIVYRMDGDGRRDLWTASVTMLDPLVSDRGDVVDVDLLPDNGSAAALTFFVNGAETGKLALGELLTDIEAAVYNENAGYLWFEGLEWNGDHHLVATTVEGKTFTIDPRNPVLPVVEPAIEPAVEELAVEQVAADDYPAWECGTGAALVEQELERERRWAQVRNAALIGLPLGALIGVLILGRIRRRRAGVYAPRAGRTTVR